MNPHSSGKQETVLREQFQVLHDVFGRYGIAMTLAGTTHTVNASWSAHSEEVNMKTTLRRGTYGALNMYVQDLYPTLGRCFYPVASATPGSRDFILDGCQIDVNTVPGGASREGNNRGFMAVHEVGHWFGLAHTFTGAARAGTRSTTRPHRQRLRGIVLSAKTLAPICRARIPFTTL
ncbi:metalloprotease 1 [Colletotrichum tofieldiae]|nr:metalloprotease 1 [Colletotrichum tofieldiae]